MKKLLPLTQLQKRDDTFVHLIGPMTHIVSPALKAQTARRNQPYKERH